MHASLPVRERGLKQYESTHGHKGSESLPVRERGLKRSTNNRSPTGANVAPRAGAWIEA